MKDIIEKEQFYPHPINAVWNAISSGSEISQWFLQADFEAKVGYRYTFKRENAVITGEVILCEPVYKLSYTWLVGDKSVETTVTWDLEEKDGGTLLRLQHEGISKFPGESAEMMFGSFVDGWTRCFSELDVYLRKK